jgi:hypothetical protein
MWKTSLLIWYYQFTDLPTNCFTYLMTCRPIFYSIHLLLTNLICIYSNSQKPTYMLKESASNKLFSISCIIFCITIGFVKSLLRWIYKSLSCNKMTNKMNKRNFHIVNQDRFLFRFSYLHLDWCRMIDKSCITLRFYIH